MSTLAFYLNELAGTSGLDEQGAANALAGTSGLALQGALNVAAGTSGVAVQGCLNRLAGTQGLGPVAAASMALSRTGLAFQLDAVNVNGYGVAQPSDGASVSTWVDLSGNGRDVTSAGVTRPTFRVSSSPNGLPSVDFDGSDDYMTSAVFNIPQPFTVYAACKAETLKTAGVVWDMATTGAAGNRSAFVIGPGSFWTGYSGTNLSSAVSEATGNHVFTYVANGGSSYAARNGVGASGAAGAQSLDGVTVGRRYAVSGTAIWDGPFYALLIYTSAHGATTRANIERRLARKYGITL